MISILLCCGMLGLCLFIVGEIVFLDNFIIFGYLGIIFFVIYDFSNVWGVFVWVVCLIVRDFVFFVKWVV